MKKVIMHKWQVAGTPTYGWSIEEVWNDWEHVYSDPYFVEIPDDFSLQESYGCELMYFREGYSYGYQLTSSDDHRNCVPMLVGGSEIIQLKVLGPVEE